MPRHSICRLLPSRLTRSGLILPVVLTLVFLFAPFAHAQDTDDADEHDSHARIVRVSYVDGEVRLDSGHGYENVTVNVPVMEHNWLQTRSDGWAEVQLEDGSLIRLAPDTQVAFTELARLSSGGVVTTIDLDQGEAEFKIAKHDDSEFQVTVKNKTIVLAHSGTFRITSTNNDPLEVAVFKGEVDVRDPESGGEVAVKKNETFVVDAADIARYALDKGTEADELDQWSKQRDDYLSSYAANRNYAQSPYQYGVNDLNYYGQYYDVAGYGNVWQPNGVGQGWDPFLNGYWGFSPGFGSYWVSSYPWGWMPYRYGQWVFINGRGWFWAPGGWHSWHTLPRWANAPPGFRPPIPPVDRQVVGGTPGQGRPGGSGRIGGVAGPVGGLPGDRGRGGRRVLTNDDVQAKVPRNDVPRNDVPRSDVPATPPAAVGDTGHTPVVVGQAPTSAGGVHIGTPERFHGDHQAPSVSRTVENQTPAAPVNHSRFENAPPAARPEPPSQPARQQYTPAPQPAPAPRQVSSPPAMHSSSSGSAASSHSSGESHGRAK